MLDTRPHSASFTEAAAIRRQEMEEVLRVLGELPESGREALLMAIDEKLDSRKVAEVLGLSLSFQDAVPPTRASPRPAPGEAP